MVTGELKGADAKAQVIVLWPLRSGQGHECVATLGDWRNPKTVRTGCTWFSCLTPQLPMFLHTHTLVNPILGQGLTTDFGYLDFGVSREQKAGLTGINLPLLHPKDKVLEIHDFLLPRIQ